LAPIKIDYFEYVQQRARDKFNQSPQANRSSEVSEEQPHLAYDLDGMFNFGSLFSPAGAMGSELQNTLYDTIPVDWNAEFDFGML